MQFWLQNSQLSTTAAPRPRHPTFRPQGRTSTPAQRRSAEAAVRPQPKGQFAIVVLGDSLGSDLSRGLSDTFGSDADIDVIDATSDDAGLVQFDAAAWGETLDDAVGKAGHADAAVVVVGSLDRQSLTDLHGSAAQVGSEAWLAAYGERAERVVAVFKDRHIPLIWIGLPIARDTDQAQFFASLNTVLRDHVARAGATFVDSWEAFTAENGQYDASGPDVNGQQSRLRRNDGLHFTRAGARKLASFVEADLRQAQDQKRSGQQLASLKADDQTLFDQALQVDINAQIRREAGLPPSTVPAGPKSYPIVELTVAPKAANGQLATASEPLNIPADAEAVLLQGKTPPPQPGRTDDFTWPASAGAAQGQGSRGP